MAEGLVASAAHPGGNITGVGASFGPEDRMTKHLQLLKEMVPRMKRVACLIDTTWDEDGQLAGKGSSGQGGANNWRSSRVDPRRRCR